MLNAQNHTGIGRAHLGEAHHIVHRDIGIGAHIAQHRQAAGAIGQCVGQARTDRLLLALCQIPKRCDVGRGGSGHGTGRAGREKRVRIALLDGTARKHDRGLALGHHGANGIVLHADDVGGLQGLHAGMRRGKGVDDFGRTDGQDLDLGICRKRGLNAVKNNLGLLVSAHNVYTNANVTHFICSLYKNGRLIEPAIVVPVGTASHPEYTVTR